jgi:hypothetical protein
MKNYLFVSNFSDYITLYMELCELVAYIGYILPNINKTIDYFD